MKTHKRYIDNQCRIVIPHKIRNAMGLQAGDSVEFELTDDNSIKLRFAKERCALCDTVIEEGTKAYQVSEGYTICEKCGRAVVNAFNAKKSEA